MKNSIKKLLSAVLAMVVVLGSIAMFTACNKKTKYSITYELDGGTNHASNPGTYTEDDLPLTIHEPTPAEGFVFLGWDCDELDIKERAQIEIPIGTRENLTFKAVWEEMEVLEENEYSITYRLNNGTNAGTNPSKYNADTDLPLTIAAPTRGTEGEFEFLGWVIVGVTTKPEKDFVISVGTKSHMILEAHWNRLKAPVGYEIGKKEAPGFTLYNTKGEQVSLSDFKGKKAVFLSFWEYNCTICKAEMKDYFNDVYDEMKDEVEILGIHIESNEKLKAHLKEKNIYYSFPILNDEDRNAVNQSSAKTKYHIGGTPSNYMVDKWGFLYSPDNPSASGDVTTFHVGTIGSKTSMKNIINAALARGAA